MTRLARIRAKVRKYAAVPDLGHGGEYPVAGSQVSGFDVLNHVPNIESITASSNNPHVLSGIREVPMSAFDPGYKPNLYSNEKFKKTHELKRQLGQSKKIKPLIVMIDHEGPYILEGGHRFDALHMMGVKSFPAVVAIDRDLAGDDPAKWKWIYREQTGSEKMSRSMSPRRSAARSDSPSRAKVRRYAAAEPNNIHKAWEVKPQHYAVVRSGVYNEPDRPVSVHPTLFEAFSEQSRLQGAKSPHDYGSHHVFAVYPDGSTKIVGYETDGYHEGIGGHYHPHTRKPDFESIYYRPPHDADAAPVSLHRLVDNATYDIANGLHGNPKRSGIDVGPNSEVMAFVKPAMDTGDMTPLMALADYLEERGVRYAPEFIRRRVEKFHDDVDWARWHRTLRESPPKKMSRPRRYAAPRIRSFWISPQGEMHEVPEAGHEAWAQRNHGVGMAELSAKGWGRVVSGANDTIFDRFPARDNPNPAQMRALTDHAIENNHLSIMNGVTDRPLWSRSSEEGPGRLARRVLRYAARPKLTVPGKESISRYEGESAPSVDFDARDLQNPEDWAKQFPGATVHRRYIPIEQIPPPKLAEEEEQKPDDWNEEEWGEWERPGYSWEDFEVGRKPFPPPKLLWHNGQLSILDGNHRIEYWNRGNYTHIPALVIVPKQVTPKQKMSRLPRRPLRYAKVKTAMDTKTWEAVKDFYPVGR